MPFQFKPWRPLAAYYDRPALARFLGKTGQSGQSALKKAILSPPKTGRLYGSHRASAPGEFPANKTGALYRSVKAEKSADSVSFGATAFYGGFLAYGTKRMAARRMSRETLEELTPQIRARLPRWIYFKAKK